MLPLIATGPETDDEILMERACQACDCTELGVVRAAKKWFFHREPWDEDLNEEMGLYLRTGTLSPWVRFYCRRVCN